MRCFSSRLRRGRHRYATNLAMAQLIEGKSPSRRTDGHDPTLFTHTTTLPNVPARWPSGRTPWTTIFRSGSDGGDLEHERWLLAPTQSVKEVAEVAWIPGPGRSITDVSGIDRFGIGGAARI